MRSGPSILRAVRLHNGVTRRGVTVYQDRVFFTYRNYLFALTARPVGRFRASAVKASKKHSVKIESAKNDAGERVYRVAR